MLTHWQVYQKELYSGYGFPIWEADPMNPRYEIQIGDVGYMADGRFRRVFNVIEGKEGFENAPESVRRAPLLLPASEASDWEERQVFIDGPIISGHATTSSIGAGAGGRPVANIRGQFEIKYTNEQCAALFLRSPAKPTIYSESHFKDYAKERWPSWSEHVASNPYHARFANALILIHGHTKTKSWASVVLQHEGRRGDVAFSATIPGFGEASVQFLRESEVTTSPFKAHGPQQTVPDSDSAAGDNGNQGYSVFAIFMAAAAGVMAAAAWTSMAHESASGKALIAAILAISVLAFVVLITFRTTRDDLPCNQTVFIRRVKFGDGRVLGGPGTKIAVAATSVTQKIKSFAGRIFSRNAAAGLPNTDPGLDDPPAIGADAQVQQQDSCDPLDEIISYLMKAPAARYAIASDADLDNLIAYHRSIGGSRTASVHDILVALALRPLVSSDGAATIPKLGSAASIFLSWIDITVDSISDALWYIGRYPPPAASQPTRRTVVEPTSSFAARTTDALSSTPPKPLPIHFAATVKLPIWALAIGIDKYQDSRITQLSGCVADANDFVDFLVERMNVPRAQIRALHNRYATRRAIISSITALSGDDRILPGDAIVIFFAGYGAEAHLSPGSSADEHGSDIEMICAYDFVPATTEKEDGQGISDTTLSALLLQLAEAKGNNITVIFDTCFPVPMNRTNQYTPGLPVRGMILPSSYKVLSTVDEALLRKVPDQQRELVANKTLEKTGISSHILLSACSPSQISEEYQGRGRFTFALFSLLRSSTVDLSAVTYRDIISLMPDLPRQTPQCIGVYASRTLFNGGVPNADRVFYRVTSEDSIVTLEAGEAQGVTKGTQFNVFGSEGIRAQTLGSITAERPLACSTIMNPGTTQIPPLAWAVRTRAGESIDVAIALPVDNVVLPVLMRAVQEMQTRPQTKRNLRFIDIRAPPEHEVAVGIEDGSAVFELTDKSWTSEGLKRLSYKIPIDRTDSLYNVLDHSADFFYHLRHSSKARGETGISKNVSLEAYEVKSVEAYDGPMSLPKFVQVDAVNLNRSGVIRVHVEEGGTVELGFKLSSNLDRPLYVWAFAFDLSDLSISTIYRPAFTTHRGKGTATKDPSIPAYGSLTIGYGSSGTGPLSVEMSDEDDVDVSYVKFFMTTEYVDLSKIEQRSPFDDKRGFIAEPPVRQLYEALLVSVIVKKVKH